MFGALNHLNELQQFPCARERERIFTCDGVAVVPTSQLSDQKMSKHIRNYNIFYGVEYANFVIYICFFLQGISNLNLA